MLWRRYWQVNEWIEVHSEYTAVKSPGAIGRTPPSCVAVTLELPGHSSKQALHSGI
jgi:hypothetical protein